MATFLIAYTDRGFHFRFVAADASLILKSSLFVCRCLCEDAISGVMRLAEFDTSFKRFTGEDGRFCFTMVDEDDEIIIHSEMYDSEEEREDVINQVRKYADSAEVDLFEEEN